MALDQKKILIQIFRLTHEKQLHKGQSTYHGNLMEKLLYSKVKGTKVFVSQPMLSVFF